MYQGWPGALAQCDQSAKAEVGVPFWAVCLPYMQLSAGSPPALTLFTHTGSLPSLLPPCAPGVAHMMGKEGEHRLAQLRHEGTRVVPVFVLALAEHPADVVLSNRWEGRRVCRRTLLYCPSWLLWLALLKPLHAMPAHTPASNPHTAVHTPTHPLTPALSHTHPHTYLTACCRELVAADHDAVVVLQLRSGMRWGAPSEFYTGHNANGRRVTLDASDPTRHIIAGLAKSLAGEGAGGGGGRGVGEGAGGSGVGGRCRGAVARENRCFEGHRGASQILAFEGVYWGGRGGGQGGGQFPGWNRVGQQETGGTAAGDKQQVEGARRKRWCGAPSGFSLMVMGLCSHVWNTSSS